MKNLLTSLLLLLTIVVANAQERGPFAPKGSSWKHWYADENTTGYINTIVVDTVLLKGYINGSETKELVSVMCSEMNNTRAYFAFGNAQSYEELSPDSLDKSKAKYMFREGNKAYVYDRFDSTFYKLIDMDAQPGDSWEMSLFNGSYEYPWSHVEFYHDTAQGVPAELIPYWEMQNQTYITDANWACYLTYQPFADSLLANGITQAQLDYWIDKYATCVTSGPALGTKDEYPEIFNKVTLLLTSKGYSWTESTWACDFKYIDENIYKFKYSEGIDYQVRKQVYDLCETRLNVQDPPAPMPDSLARLWYHMEPVYAGDGNVTNYDFHLVTKYNWPRYVDTWMVRDLAKPIEEGGLGITIEEAEEKYKNLADHKYDSIPVPGDVDLIQVTEKMNMEVNGLEIPVITMGPACESLLDAEAVRSNITIYGALNIDYLNLHAEPWVQEVEKSSSYEIHYHGLLCANNGDKSLVTPNLQEYFDVALPHKDVADCDEIEAPKFTLINAPAMAKAAGDNPFGTIDASTADAFNMKSAFANEQAPKMIVNVVVHVVHNEDVANTKVSKEMINEMLTEINKAFTGTNDQSSLNATFADVVGAPNIELILAETDPQGNATDGIVYHTTTEEYFTVGMGSSIKEQYAFKFNDVGTPLAWDHTKYLNIFIADFGSLNGGNVGGFVTNPTSDNSNKQDLYAWYKSNDLKFWRDWLNDTNGDAPSLDGLSLDYYATFYADSLANIKYKTAIHELGHYFGLRHTFSTLVEQEVGYNEWGMPITKEVLYGDNFDDTPEQYYKTFVYDDCAREPYQCGHQVMVNNWMDYSLPCACAFTKEQSAFMREFTLTLRSGVANVNWPASTASIQALQLDVCPNPTQDVVNVSMDSDKPFSVRVYNLQGKIIDEMYNVTRQAELFLGHQPNGMYMVKIVQDGQLIATEKVLKK